MLARHASAGARTAVVPSTWTAGGHRAAEFARTLEILGAGAPRLPGYADARNPASAVGDAVRLVAAPLDEAVGRPVAHLREVRPDIVVGHDAPGRLTGHPDHRRAHQITLLAVRSATGSSASSPSPGSPPAPRRATPAG